MRLSYSAISTYQKCPLSYKFQYIEKLPTKPSHHLSFGSSIHSALEFFYNVELPEPCSLERLLKELDNVWLSEGYENDAQQKEYKEKGRAILTRFYEENLPSFAVPIAVEKKFSLDMDGITLVGVIDRIDGSIKGSADDWIKIIDYKTNSKLPPKTKIDTDLQLPIYHIAAEKMFGIAPSEVTLYFLVPNKKESRRKTKADIKRAQDTIHKVAGDISKGKFDPLKNPLCPWCDFIESCPLHVNDPVILARAAANGKISSGKEINKSEFVIGIKELKQSAVEIENAVDEYLGLIEQIGSARKRLDELQRIIHSYCEVNNLTSIRGARGRLTRRAQKTTHYNVEKLRELLEPRGLWEKVIDVNGQLLKKLLDDETSQAELRKLIDTVKEVEEISYALYVKDEPSSESL